MDRKIEKQLLDKANVMSVGYGRKIINGEMTDKPCIMVGVTKKIEASALTKQDLVPNKVNEMETDVFEVGFIKAQQEVDPKHKFRPAMPGVSIGHKCYDKNTRVLTSKGLRYFYEITKNDEIATLSKDGSLEWQNPTGIFEYEHEGDMVLIDQRTINLCVTKNHNVYFRNRARKNSSFCLSSIEDVLKKNDYQQIQFKRDCTWHCIDFDKKSIEPQGELVEEYASFIRNEPFSVSERTRRRWIKKTCKPRAFNLPLEFDSKLWVQFLGWYLSEGSTQKNTVVISEKSKEHHDEIIGMFESMGLLAHKDKYGNIKTVHASLSSYLKKFGKAHQKFIPREIKDLPPIKLKILLSALMKGDGHIKNGKYRHYKTVSKQLAHDVLEIGLKCGYGVTISEYKPANGGFVNGRQITGRHNSYRIGFSYSKLTPRLSKEPKIIHYVGKIYCLEVPNHVIFVERNGKTCWCGNSITAGTFGCVVQRNGEKLILSNNHVLAACHDEKTEVLTKQGFKFWENITKDDLMATLDTNTGKLVYQKPDEIHKYYYNGDLFHFKGKCIDIQVTPNHRMWAKRTYKSGPPKHIKDSGFNFFTAEYIYNDMMQHKSVAYEFTDKARWHCRAPETIKLPESKYKKGKNHNYVHQINIDDWLYFLGWYLADGSATINSCNGQKLISIRSTSDKNLKDLKDLCDRMQIRSHEIKCGAIQILSKQLYDILSPLGRSHNKFIPEDIKELHPDKLKFLLNGYLRGDGFDLKSEQKGSLSKSKRLSDDIQEIWFKLGVSSKQKIVKGSPFNPDGIYYRVDSRKRSSLRLQSLPEKIKYSGYVYCATVANGTLLTRRNGYIVWSGNSNDARIGDAIYQPGAYDGGTFLDKIGTLFDFIPLVYEGNNNDGGGTGGGGGTCSFAKKTASIANFAAKTLGRKHRLMAYNPEAEVNLIDAALAKPDNPSDILDEIINIGKPAGIAEINIGDKVQKYGRTTGYTTGTVISVGATTNVSYGTNKMATFRNQIMTGDMSDGGDSGSAVLDMNKNIVGLLFAGSDQVTIFCPIQTVFELLNISL